MLGKMVGFYDENSSAETQTEILSLGLYSVQATLLEGVL